MKSLFDFFVLVGFEEVADNYEETFVGFELLFGEFTGRLGLRGFVGEGWLRRGFGLNCAIGG
jgi:hypothetical protein